MATASLSFLRPQSQRQTQAFGTASSMAGNSMQSLEKLKASADALMQQQQQEKQLAATLVRT